MTQVISGTLGEVLKQAVEAGIPPLTTVRLLWEGEEQPSALSENADAIAYLQERLGKTLTDAEQIRRAEGELETLHESLNRNRIDTGDRPLFAKGTSPS